MLSRLIAFSLRMRTMLGGLVVNCLRVVLKLCLPVIVTGSFGSCSEGNCSLSCLGRLWHGPGLL